MTKTSRKTKKIAIIATAMMSILLVVISLFTMFNTASAYKLLTWNLVDSGKHLDWDGSTNYMTEWNKSIKVWEDYKPGVIRPDSAWVIEDVKISDYYEESNTMAVTSSAGTIKFNKYHFASMSAGERQKTMTHELGHALGLDENNSVPNSIMCQGKRSQTYIIQDDKNGYDAAYQKYSQF